MVRFALKGTLVAGLALFVTLGLAGLSHAQSLTGATPDSSAQSSTEAAPASVVFGRLSVLGKGKTTTSVGAACADAPCPSGDICSGCVSWSGLALQGGFAGTSFSAPTLTGDFTVDVSHAVTSGSGTGVCFQAAGPATIFTNASKNASITMALIGQVCTAGASSSVLTFSGNYLTTGGTGFYSTAEGSGAITADLNNQASSTRHTVEITGTMLN